jgi:serine/threonine-protein kinase
VVLVEACTGTVPVVGDTAFGTIALRAARGIEAPMELGPLRPVLTRAGRPDPNDRYPDAAAMGAALTRAARELPPPQPLTLAGLGEGVDDVEPTSIGRSRGPSTGDPARDDTLSESPLEIIDEPRHAVMRRSAIPMVVGAAIVLALAIGGVFLTAAGGAPVTVPSIVGMQRADAAKSATEAGVFMKVVEVRRSEDPAGLVIEQRPGPGAFLREGDEVEVVVSRGPPPVPVPDVAGKPSAEAKALLEQAGFVVQLVPKHDENIAADIALGTDPPFGKRHPPESTIKLIVSDGPAPVPVPEVAGKSYDEAVQILKDKRLGATRRDDFSDTVAPGVVIGTEPAAGELAPRDSAVTVVVSKGPELVQVPNVVGMTVEAASQALRDAGLKPDVENYSPGGTVVAQAPTGGTTVKKGSTVRVFL